MATMGAIFYSRYRLSPRKALSARVTAHARDGALLRVQWANGLVGYADLFPWPEFGDLSLEQELMALANDRPTALGFRALELAEWDAGLRAKHKTSWGQKIFNHALINDLSSINEQALDDLGEQGFTCLKIKVSGKSLPTESIESLRKILAQQDFKVRLDFNATGTPQSFAEFCDRFTDKEKAQIEFVEDPMPWNLAQWQEAARQLPLAMDFEERHVEWREDVLPFHYLIAKPVRKSLADLLTKAKTYGLKVCITSAMDHPVGVATAAAELSALRAGFGESLTAVHGLLSLGAYEPNSYNELIQVSGPEFLGVTGTGIGFDDLLARETWQELRP